MPAHAQLLRDARKALGPGMTGKVVAKKLGCSDSAYYLAESGHFGNIVFANLEKAFPKEAVAEIRDAWENYHSDATPTQVDAIAEPTELAVPDVLLQGLAEARLTRFHPSRKYYRLLRDGKSTISDYVGTAGTKLEMVSITLATGNDLEKVTDTFEDLIRRRNPVTVVVSLLDPEQEYLMKAIAGVSGSSAASLAMRINDAVNNLTEFRNTKLRKSDRRYFELHAHATLPNFSAIIIDGDDSRRGLVQLETKGYKMGMHDSFGFEVSYGSDFYRNLRDSYRHLIRDGRRIF